MVMGVPIEIGAMALAAGSSLTAINRGVTTSINPNTAVAIGWIMARGTGSVYCRDAISGVAVDAERGWGHRSGVVMSVSTKVGSMASATSSSPGDGGDQGAASQWLQGWW